MNQPEVSASEATSLNPTNLGLAQAAARDLEGYNPEGAVQGHWPSWIHRVPDGLALCIGCWQVITALQLGVEPCSGGERLK
jgi:hypothetical protein